MTRLHGSLLGLPRLIRHWFRWNNQALDPHTTVDHSVGFNSPDHVLLTFGRSTGRPPTDFSATGGFLFSCVVGVGGGFC